MVRHRHDRRPTEVGHDMPFSGVLCARSEVLKRTDGCSFYGITGLIIIYDDGDAMKIWRWPPESDER